MKPNVVLISIDTLRADHVSSYGYNHPTTPNLDRLARGGTRFTNAYSTAVWTPPAHTSMLTGLFPSQHGVIDTKKLNSDIPTLAAILQQNGYATSGFVNNPQVGAFVGLDKGHDVFHEVWQGVTSKNILARGWHFLFRTFKTLAGSKDHGAAKTNKLVKSWLNHQVKNKENQPFYMFIHYIEPHNPFMPIAEFRKQFVKNEPPKNVNKKKIAKVAYNPLICYTDNIELNQDEKDYLVSMYDAEIAYIDKKVGEVVAKLEALGVLENTLLIITADHGEHFGEHGHYSHVGSLHQEIVNVPLLIRFPGKFIPNCVSNKPVQLIDIVPTVLDAVEVDKSFYEELPGISLIPDGNNITVPDERPVIAEWEGRIPEFITNRFKDLGRSMDKSLAEMIQKKLKMVIIKDEKYIFSELGEGAFYNLREDPDELNDLSKSHEAKCKMFSETYEDYISNGSSHTETEDAEMDQKVKDRLKDLGYL